MTENHRNDPNLPATTPSSSTPEFIIASSITNNRSSFRAIEETQASDVKRRRLNTNNSRCGKKLFGQVCWSHLFTTDDVNTLRIHFKSS